MTDGICTEGIEKGDKEARKKERMPNCQRGPLFLARRKGKKMDDYMDAIAAAMWENICWKIAMKNELLLSLPPLLTRYHIEIQCHVRLEQQH
jgi:hypothetical protein